MKSLGLIMANLVRFDIWKLAIFVKSTILSTET